MPVSVASTTSPKRELPRTPPALRQAALAGIFLLALLTRVPLLDHAPPGLHQDEAANAWNAWCLLHTGRDQVGERWPIFCMRAIGDYRSTLYTYTLLPFLALGDLDDFWIRLPAALGGTLTVLLLYWVGARLFNHTTGLAAAALLAINPTHIQLSRLALEASQTPLLTLLPLAAWIWAGLPPAGNPAAPRAGRCFAAGLLTGLCCYGYPAARMFVPVFLCGTIAVTLPAWLALLRTRSSRPAVGLLVLGTALTFGPLAYKHLTEPEMIAKRGRTTWVWTRDDPAAARVSKVAQRFAGHFHPRFLFVSGDQDETFWTTGVGYMPRYAAPLMLIGLGTLLMRVSRSRAARVLLVGVILYPVADALNWHISLHGLRCSAGLWTLALLSGIGLHEPLAFLYRRRLHAWLLAASVAAGALIVPETAQFVGRYVFDRPDELPVYYGTHQDLLAAAEWLRPRVDEVDRVICFAAGPNVGYTPYLMMLIALRHDPHAWFDEPRVVEPKGPWDRCVGYGKFHFLYGDERAPLLEQLRSDGRTERVVLLLREGERPPCEPTHVVRSPDGAAAIIICDCRL
jgi:4-amino-4-deoxy-L-arabinose transferase-like glycosyltransferase